MTWSINPYSIFNLLDETKPKCVVISGWSFKANIFDTILPGLSAEFNLYLAEATQLKDYYSFEQYAASLAEQIECEFNQPVWLMGWSLGANISYEIARQKKSKTISGLMLLGWTPCFVQKPDWSNAVTEEDFHSLKQLIQIDSKKGLSRFDQLQLQHDKNKRLLYTALKAYRQENIQSLDDLLQGLTFLQTLDQRENIHTIETPVQLIYGGNDQLIHQLVSKKVLQHNSKVSVNVIPDVSHLMFLSDPDSFFDIVGYFIKQTKKTKAKLAIAERFSRAAKTYDQFAGLQKRVGHKLTSMLPNQNVELILDAGCGTGFWSEKLKAKSDYYIGFDLAMGMLEYSKKNYTEEGWLCTDIELLPFANERIDCIFSNLVVQWASQLSELLAEWYRVIPKGGSAIFSTLLDKTLFELKSCSQKIDDASHVNSFLDLPSLKEICHGTQFSSVDIAQESIVLEYSKAVDILKDLKGIGATFIQQGGRKGLMCKSQLLSLLENYESFRLPNGNFPATYEVAYIRLEK